MILEQFLILTKATIIDLWGLANMQVAKAKKNNVATPDFLNTSNE